MLLTFAIFAYSTKAKAFEYEISFWLETLYILIISLQVNNQVLLYSTHFLILVQRIQCLWLGIEQGESTEMVVWMDSRRAGAGRSHLDWH